MKEFCGKVWNWVNGGSTKSEEEEYYDDVMVDGDEGPDYEPETVVTTPVQTAPVAPSYKVNNQTTRVSKEEMNVIFVEPKTFEDAKAIVRNLNDNRPVIVNLENTDKAEAYRITDFLSGATFAISGDLGKVGTNIFFCTPRSVKVDYNQKPFVDVADASTSFPTFTRENE